MLLYMAQEGRGIGLLNKLKAYELQEQGLDTVEANVAARLPRRPARLRHRLADPRRPRAHDDPPPDEQPEEDLGHRGLRAEIVEQVPIEVPPNDENRRYLEAKRDKLGHGLHHQDMRFEPELYDGPEA